MIWLKAREQLNERRVQTLAPPSVLVANCQVSLSQKVPPYVHEEITIGYDRAIVSYV